MKNKKEKKVFFRTRESESARRMAFFASHTEEEIRAALGVGGALSEEEVREMRAQYGENVLPEPKKRGVPARLAAAFVNPFSVILLVLAAISYLTEVRFAAAGEKNPVTVCVIAVMVVVSGVLHFVQETRNGSAAAKLRSLLTTTACVQREDGERREIPVGELVVGDRVFLSAGDMVPADLRILAAKDLFIAQSALTGESAPCEKSGAPAQDGSLSSPCLAFLGTNVLSGSGECIVAATGKETYLGRTAGSLAAKPEKSAFDRGIAAVSRLLVACMLCMVPVVLLVNGFTKNDWLGAALFAISVAVGLTPEMLPMIVTACLAKGSVAMSKKKVIVKQMGAIQSLGSADVLCTDKTGTLTCDEIVLERHLDADGREDVRVLRHAFLNSYCQTGLKNLLDAAIIRRMQEAVAAGEADAEVLTAYTKVDEIPFDFERRRMSVVVRNASGKTQLITKGAPQEMLAACSFVDTGGQVCPLDDARRAEVLRRIEALGAQGMRVLCVAHKTNPAPAGAFCAADERDMVLIGYLAFLDPPKPSAAAAIARLKKGGVTVKVLTGDAEDVAACVCAQVGLDGGKRITGAQLEGLSEEQLARVAEENTLFARLSPAQKEAIVRALRANGHTVAFLGDGINDAPAMRAADVGISVDTATDIAKESAAAILLEKDLTVIADGMREGRKTYANMMKYIKITASSNFGNMFSVLAASAFLPFLPMLSVQLILLNLVYDLSCIALPWDNVDEELLAAPAVWESASVAKFMVCFGPISSLFDIATYLFLFFVLCPAVCGAPYAQLSPALAAQFAALFRTGWFVESIFTQSLVLHALRSRKTPFFGSRASAPVFAFTLGGVALLTALPYTPAGRALGLCALPAGYYAFLAAAVAGYLIAVTLAKRLYARKFKNLL